MKYGIIFHMAPSNGTKRVVIALDFARPNGQGKFAGIMRFLNARKLHWDIRLKRGPGEFLPIDVKRLPNWNVDGIIYSIPTRGSDTKTATRLLAKLGKPLVVIDPDDPSLFNDGGKKTIFVRTDADSIGAAAVEHLAGQPHYRSFGYVHDTLVRSWSVLCGNAFNAALSNQGLVLKTYRPPHADVDDFQHLREWLRALPKPASVLTASDDRAITVYEACDAERLAIPNDVSILSIDNDRLICDNLTPALSSIAPDHEKEGYAAAAMLSQLMRGGRISRRHEYAYPIKSISVRASSLPAVTGAGLVHRALRLIRENVRRPATPDAIADALLVSRSLLDQRFRSIRGNTLHAEIEIAKLNEVKDMLETTSATIKEIAAACGFPDQFYLMRLFKRRFGTTMRDWRNTLVR